MNCLSTSDYLDSSQNPNQMSLTRYNSSKEDNLVYFLINTIFDLRQINNDKVICYETLQIVMMNQQKGFFFQSRLDRIYFNFVRFTNVQVAGIYDESRSNGNQNVHKSVFIGNIHLCILFFFYLHFQKNIFQSAFSTDDNVDHAKTFFYTFTSRTV